MPTRRDVFRTASATAAVLATRPLHASVDRVGPRVREARMRWRQRVDEVVHVQRGSGPVDAGQEAALRRHARGLLALDAYRDVGDLSLEDQCHPAVQSLMTETAEALGASMTDAADRLQAWLDDPDTASDTGIALLADQARGLGRQSEDLELGRQRSRLFHQSVPEEGITPEQLRRRARKGLHRLRKLQRVAARVAADPTRRQLQRTPDADTAARIDMGQARWGRPRHTGAGLTILGILGIIVLGLIIIGGFYVAVVGLCGIACGAGSVGVGVMLLGLAIIVGAIIGIVAIIKGLVRQGKD